MAYMEIKNVTFTYANGFEAIRGLDISIDKGEKVAIIGENGAGKSTTAKLINGLLRPTTGDVIIDGANTKDCTTAQVAKKVGYVFQNPDDQIFNNTVFKEVAYTPKYYKLSPEEIERRVSRALQLTGLDKKRDTNPYDLSYAHRKFVTIAAVLAMDCKLIILDEPTAGQDKDGMDRLAEIISTLESEGKIILTISHDMEFVVRNFERTIVMAHGNKIADGNKREIFWQLDKLREAALHQPYISQLARESGMKEQVITIDDFLNALRHP